MIFASVARLCLLEARDSGTRAVFVAAGSAHHVNSQQSTKQQVGSEACDMHIAAALAPGKRYRGRKLPNRRHVPNNLLHFYGQVWISDCIVLLQQKAD